MEAHPLYFTPDRYKNGRNPARFNQADTFSFWKQDQILSPCISFLSKINGQNFLMDFFSERQRTVIVHYNPGSSRVDAIW